MYEESIAFVYKGGRGAFEIIWVILMFFCQGIVWVTDKFNFKNKKRACKNKCWINVLLVSDVIYYRWTYLNMSYKGRMPWLGVLFEVMSTRFSIFESVPGIFSVPGYFSPWIFTIIIKFRSTLNSVHYDRIGGGVWKAIKF
jgi:hypothetical protein